jgi:putative ABC transport system permease protein
MNFSEIFKMSIESVRANAMRSVLTLLIIAVGIMALVGILTALDSVLNSLNESFNDMGSNSFAVLPKSQGVGSNQGGRRQKVSDEITFDQALAFKDRYNYPAKVAISTAATGSATVQRGEKKTNPNINISGIDENYLDVKGYDLTFGRNFSNLEVQSGANKAVVGTDIVKLLFENKPEKALNEDILLGNIRYTIIGILKEKGSSGPSQGANRVVMIPILNSKRTYNSASRNVDVDIAVASAIEMDNATDVAIVTFRQIRKLKVGQADDFEIFKSDSLLDILKENTVKIRWATIAIGLITLLGASIGLMNIMLVSVTERTREIGIRKALGATRSSILTQFLTEAIVICQMGGFVGIFLGVLAGLGVSVALKSTFIMPWAWIILGVTVCFVVGLFAGLYPALRAARLDPIESLRYE